MIRTDLEDISEEEFEKVILPCVEEMHNYIVDNFLNETVAHHIATYFKGNAMLRQNLNQQLNSAVEDLAQFTAMDCDIEKIKEILEKEYKLKIKNDSPLDIEEVKN